MFAIQAPDKAYARARPLAAPPTYRTSSHGVRAPCQRRREIDVEGCVALALVALGCAAPVVETVARGETFSSEATVCGVLLVLSLALLLLEAARWFRARAKAHEPGAH
jgi:hypothetical protein